jgi:hypothetical protein
VGGIRFFAREGGCMFVERPPVYNRYKIGVGYIFGENYDTGAARDLLGD